MSGVPGVGRKQFPETRALLAILREFPDGIKAKELRIVARARGIKPQVADPQYWVYRVLKEAEQRGDAVWLRHGYWRARMPKGDAA